MLINFLELIVLQKFVVSKGSYVNLFESFRRINNTVCAIARVYVNGVNSKMFFFVWFCLDSVCIAVSAILRNLFWQHFWGCFIALNETARHSVTTVSRAAAVSIVWTILVPNIYLYFIHLFILSLKVDKQIHKTVYIKNQWPCIKLQYIHANWRQLPKVKKKAINLISK